MEKADRNKPELAILSALGLLKSVSWYRRYGGPDWTALGAGTAQTQDPEPKTVGEKSGWDRGTAGWASPGEPECKWHFRASF